MDYVKKYGELIKDKAGVKPERARSMIRLGLRAENARTKLLPNKPTSAPIDVPATALISKP